MLLKVALDIVTTGEVRMVPDGPTVTKELLPKAIPKNELVVPGS
jgi:hypothetical protein